MGEVPDGSACGYQYAHGTYCKGSLGGLYRIQWVHRVGLQRQRVVCGYHLDRIEAALLTLDLGSVRAVPVVEATRLEAMAASILDNLDRSLPPERK